MHNWSTFGARTNHEQTQIHKTHHDPNLGEATTFPLVVSFVPGHKANTQILSRDSQVENPEISKLGLRRL
jgi:ribosome assembly protein YihI (activator of Der GTPase)